MVKVVDVSFIKIYIKKFINNGMVFFIENGIIIENKDGLVIIVNVDGSEVKFKLVFLFFDGLVSKVIYRVDGNVIIVFYLKFFVEGGVVLVVF